jgi:16S rRNA (adenine1518-N6/adenine1519-N6)-dimethyltransferase
MSHPKAILDKQGLYPKKSLGQNFIFDDNLLARIGATAELTPDDSVLEIGPGLGNLTRHLAHSSGRVVAVELDGRLLPLLHERLDGLGNVELVHGDILDWQPAEYFVDPYKVVANIPYYMTGAILRHLFAVEPRPTQMTLTVQRELAGRMAARPGKMSLFAVSVQFYAEVSIAFVIKAGAFWPRPEVDSAVVNLIGRPEMPLDREQVESFFRIVRAGFSQKRKQLQRNLRQLGYPEQALLKALAKADIDGGRRAETLSVDEWLAIYWKLTGEDKS